jgi:hypothetical protein
MAYMRCFQKVFAFQDGNSCLSVCCIHFLQFLSSELLDRSFYSVGNFFMCFEIWSKWWEADHGQRGCRFERAMYMVVLSLRFGFVEIGRHPSVGIRLRL